MEDEGEKSARQQRGRAMPTTDPADAPGNGTQAMFRRDERHLAPRSRDRRGAARRSATARMQRFTPCSARGG